jgi:hypothetical protein
VQRVQQVIDDVGSLEAAARPDRQRSDAAGDEHGPDDDLEHD